MAAKKTQKKTEKTATDPALVARLAELFRGFESASGTHGVPERDPDGLKWAIKRTARSLRTPVTQDLWEQHVAGLRPLGVIPIREDSSCLWGSIDFDEYDVDILELVAMVERSGLPLVPCVSKSGGLHLFLFLSAAVPAAAVREALLDAAASLGMAECEIFPKQTTILADRNDMGNWMVMPYFGDTFDGKLRMQHGIKPKGAEMTLGEFVAYAESKRVSVAQFVAACEARRPKAPPVAGSGAGGGKARSKTGGADAREDFSNGPPCLQHIVADGTSSDGRKRTLFMMAMYYRRADSKKWKDLTESANQRFFSPPLPSEEVVGIVRSLEKKEYEYTCKEEPMRSHCNSTACRLRKFGVGKGGEYPVINGMSRLETEPPIWFVDVENARLELATEDLQNYARFQRACMERVNKCYKVMKQDAWFTIVAEAMEKMELIPAPPDISLSGRFHEFLEEFLTNRARGQRREDLLDGRPWEDTDTQRHFFTLRALQRYLVQEGVKDMSRGQMTRRIEKLGGGSHFFNFNNKRGLHCWWIPTEVVGSGEQVAAQSGRETTEEI